MTWGRVTSLLLVWLFHPLHVAVFSQHQDSSSIFVLDVSLNGLGTAYRNSAVHWTMSVSLSGRMT
jgi:hypothetical protein